MKTLNILNKKASVSLTQKVYVKHLSNSHNNTDKV